MPVPTRVVAIPTTDAAFADEAQQIAARIPDGLSLDDALHWYRLALRRSTPSAVVREQESLARLHASQPVWYVSRTERHFRIDASVWLPLAPVDAWRVYVERLADWLRVVKLSPRTTRGPVVGREYDVDYQFLGSHWHGVLRILAAEPGRSVSVEIEGAGFTVWWIATFDPEYAATLLRVDGDYEVPGSLLARVADHRWIEGQIRRDIERAHEAYRVLCLTGDRADSAPSPLGR